MQVKSGRQFRSYVISWFLLIVGFIVFLGAYYIYHNAQDYFFSTYKKNKLGQVNTMAMLINGNQHQRMTSAKVTTSESYRLLSNSFFHAARSETFRHPVYSINFDPKTQSYRYAVDPRNVLEDSIHINSEMFELLVTVNQKKQIVFEYLRDYSAKELVTDEDKKAKPSLVSSADGVDLKLRGETILSLSFRDRLVGKIKNFTIDATTREYTTVELNVGRKTNFSYRYVLKDKLVHPPGTPYLAPLPIIKNLGASSSKNGNGIVELNPELSVSRAIIVAPIVDNKNQSTGLLLMELPSESLQRLSQTFLESVLIGFGLVMVLIMVAAIFFARKITTPLEHLNSAIARLIQNDFSFKLSAKGFGGFGFIAQQFNLMLAHIQRSRSELIHLNKSYSRFVPHQLLKQLSPSGVSNISLGDSCERDMTVLFCDIRGFTTLSESMTPQANFTFINRYLSQIAPVINKRGGIIDKYLGDGIMALFPNGADQALKAAIEMLDALSSYNEKLMQKKLPIVEVGLGLHSGRMMLGTVGTPARMDATVVSDTVNAAARVESMTKAFCTKILITEETKRQLRDLDDYNIRYIASCRIQGKSKPVTLYEVFNNDSASLKKEKEANQSMMIRAWKKYKSGDKHAAIALYQKIIEKSPHDKSLFALIERCQSGRL